MVKRYNFNIEFVQGFAPHPCLLVERETDDGAYVHYEDYQSLEYDCRGANLELDDAMTWVSVEERLPESSGRVCVWTTNNIARLPWFNRFSNKWLFDDEYIPNGEVTHWMEIKPPSENE